MLRWKYTVRVTAGLTNRQLFREHRSRGKCITIWREPVLCVNCFSTGAMSRDKAHATAFARALTHDFPVLHSQIKCFFKIYCKHFHFFFFFYIKPWKRASKSPFHLNLKALINNNAVSHWANNNQWWKVSMKGYIDGKHLEHDLKQQRLSFHFEAH